MKKASIDKKFKILLVSGTRPEFLKVFPIYQEFKSKIDKAQANIEIKWLLSGQHKDLIEDLIDFFDLKKDVKAKIIEKAKLNRNKFEYVSLAEKQAMLVSQADEVMESFEPNLAFVQGDTLTTISYAQTCFYHKVPVAYVEAGLRTESIHKPFPEELHRRELSQIADLNFTPNARALQNLEAEKILYQKKSYNFNTGNTIIDTLSSVMKKIEDENFNWNKFSKFKKAFSNETFVVNDFIAEQPKFVLLTAHRRENFGEPLKNLSKAVIDLAIDYPDFNFLLVTHPNPKARDVYERLEKQAIADNIKNIFILEPLSYPIFLKLMINSYAIVTDSGGIQEEAPYLSKPVLVFRSETERQAGLELGLARVIGTEQDSLRENVKVLIEDPVIYDSMIKNDLQPYGDGSSAKRIVEIALLYLKNNL